MFRCTIAPTAGSIAADDVGASRVSTLTVPIKTPDGVAELTTRQRRLSQRHRTVLLLVDGRRNEAQVRETSVMAGASPSCFDELVALGLIVVEQYLAPVVEVIPAPTPVAASGLTAAAFDMAESGLDSMAGSLPPSLTLQPDPSQIFDSMAGALPSSGLMPLTELDDMLDEARGVLLRAVRAEAPVTGSLTLLRLRRARSREDIEVLLDEVQTRISKPNKGLWAAQTMARARDLLRMHAVQSMPMPFA
jgi:hypothetical protein